MILRLLVLILVSWLSMHVACAQTLMRQESFESNGQGSQYVSNTVNLRPNADLNGTADPGGTALNLTLRAIDFTLPSNATGASVDFQLVINNDGQEELVFDRSEVTGTQFVTPTLTTTSPASVLTSSAVLGGNVTADGGANVTERGVVYSTTNQTPTTSDTKDTNGSGAGSFSETIPGLMSRTTYYVRAYAIDNVGTAYGAVQTFTTLNNAPVVTTTGGTTTYIIGGGAVAIDNGLTVTDADNTTLASATIRITSGLQSGQDVLQFTNTNTTTFGNIGTVAVANGTLPLSLSGGTATVAQWQAALRAVTFNNSVGTAPATPRTVEFVVNDGTTASAPATKTVTPAPPTTVVSVTRLNPLLTATAQVRYRVVFSSSVSGITVSNFSVTTTGSVSGATVSSASGSGTTYTVTVNTGTGDGTLRLNVANSTGITPTVSGLPYTAGGVYTITKSFAANPQLTIQGMGGTGSDVTAFVDVAQVLSGGSPFANGLQNSSFETHDPLDNGDFGYQPTGASWTFNAQAGIAESGSGFLPIEPIPNGIAVAFVQSNGGGNGQLQQNLAIPTGSNYQVSFQAAQRICCTTLDQSLNVFLNGVFLGNIQPNSNAYTTFTSPTFSVTAPALTATVSTTSASPTGTAPIPFSVSFSQSVGTTFTASDVTVTGGTLNTASFSGSGSGPYTFTVTPIASGTVSVSLATNVSQDANNTGNAASNTVSVQYAQPVTAAPVIISPANNTLTNQAVTISGTAPAGSDVTVYVSQTGGAFQEVGTYTATAGGTFTTQAYALPSTTYQTYATAQSPGAAVSANSNLVTFTVDQTRPTVAISSTAGASSTTTSTTPIPFTVTFSKNVTGFVAGDVTVSNGTITGGIVNGTSPGSVFTFTVTPTTAGTATTVNVPANVAVDAANNGNTGAAQYSITFSVTATPVVLTPADGTVTNQSITVTGTAPANSAVVLYFSKNGGAYQPLQVTATASGTFSSPALPFTEGTYRTYATAQSPNEAVSANSNLVTFTVDQTGPSVAITSTAGASGGNTTTTPIPFTVTFSENVTGFVGGDVAVTNGTLAGLSGSGTTYTFSVTPSASGAVRVTVVANVAVDPAGNGNTPSNTYQLTYVPPVTAAPVVISPANGSLLSTATPTYTGTAPASSTVTVYVDGTPIATTTAPAGSWSLTQPTALANSPHSVYATAQLSGQALSVASTTNSFTVDNSTLSLTLSATTLCANSPLSLTATATNTGAPVTYSLSSSPAGFLSSGTSSQLTLTAPAVGLTTSFTLTVAATSSVGNASATTVVRVNPLPAASVVASGTLTCTQPSVGLTAQGGSTYQFSGPGLLSQSANTALVGVAGTYSVTVSDGNGCSATASVGVSQDISLPSVRIDPDPATLTCANPTVILVASQNAAYRWSTGALTASISVRAAGAYSVTVTAANGCTATASTVVESNTATPTATLMSSNDLSCSVTSATLTASGGQSYAFSAGATQIGTTNQATVSTGGSYSVTVTGANGCTATATTTVTSDSAAPTASLVSSGSLTCSVTSVTLTASPNGQSYVFSAGAVQMGSSNQALVNASGQYSVTVVSANGCSSVASVSVSQDNTAPVASLVSSGSLSCAVTSVTLTASPDGQSYVFSAGATQVGTSNQAVVNASGTYSVTVISGNGCSAVASTTVAGDQSVPTASLTNNGPISCSMTSTTLTASGGSMYQFSSGVSQIGTGSTATVSTAGVYSVTVTSANGCSAVAQTTVSQDNTAPLATLSATPSTTLSCTQTSLTLTAGGGQRYAFSGPGLVSQDPTSGTAVANAAGVYSVTVTSAGGCTATQTTSLETNNSLAAPDFFTQYNQSSYPGGLQRVTVGQNTGTVTFQFNNCLGGTVNWTGQDGSSGTGNIVALTTQPGTLTYTGNCTLNSCVSPASSVTVTTTAANTPPVATANANQTATVGTAFSYTVNAFTDSETPNGLTYSASIVPANGFVFDPATRIISGTPSLSGVSSVTVVGTDPGSLSASTTFTITVSPASMTPTAPFAITGVTTLDCTPVANRINLNFTPRYAGLNSQPISFQVVNELSPTTAPGPYTLQLYPDNPVIILKATQSGTAGEASFTYNWLAACNSLSMVSPNNTPPTVANAIPPQSATVNQAFSYQIPANTFTDAETPNQLTLSASGLPPGLSLSGSTISGTPSSTAGSPNSVTVVATDPGSLSASTTFTITVSPAASATTTAPFAITGVTTLDCTPIANRITINFNPQYAGLNGQPISFQVVNELSPTTAPGPYSLTLYPDNPIITLKATQSGTAGEASFTYNWLAACNSLSMVSPNNTAPTTTGIANQSGTVNQGFSLNVAPSFSDAETPNNLSFSATGLPTGLSLSGSTISGTPSTSGVSSVTVVASDLGSLSVSTSFTLTVSPASTTVSPPPTSPFSITGVSTVSCTVISEGQREVRFTPQYGGTNGQPISFSVVNELSPTTASGPYTLRLYTDNPLITLKATQSGTAGEASFSYNWLAACNSGSGARFGAEPGAELNVRVLGNPVVGESVEVEVRGGAGQSLRVQVVSEQGYRIDEQGVEQAGSVERFTLRVGPSTGIYLLRVSPPSQSQILKLLKK